MQSTPGFWNYILRLLYLFEFFETKKISTEVCSSFLRLKFLFFLHKYCLVINDNKIYSIVKNIWSTFDIFSDIWKFHDKFQEICILKKSSRLAKLKKIAAKNTRNSNRYFIEGCQNYDIDGQIDCGTAQNSVRFGKFLTCRASSQCI